MKGINKTTVQYGLITLLRFSIGWHFLYEGFSKLIEPSWTSAKFLSGSSSLLAPFYHWLVSSESILQIVNALNIIGLIFIGLALTLGLFTKWASVFGVSLLTLYYFVYPPFGASSYMQSEGSLFIVNKIFIEASILVWFIFLHDTGYSIEKFIKQFQERRKSDESSITHTSTTRREALKNLASIPLLGVLGWGAIINKNKFNIDATTGATVRVKSLGLNELNGELPQGTIGKHQISRLVAGGNLIGGWAHSRDLKYVSELFKAYNTEKKVFETLMLAENAGINTINIGFPSNQLIQNYKRATGSKIKVITQVGPDMENKDIYKYINQAIDFGVDMIQIQGNWCDWLVRDGNYDVIVKMMDHIRSQGFVAGLASHTIDSLELCEQRGIIPDYYMKTMHHDKYWSAHPIENRHAYEVDGKKYLDHNRFHDNLFCLFPDRTVDFVKRSKVPVMGFKVLAAGAIPPEDGFKWAFENGADFICVGMFDFQVVKDVNVTLDVLNNLQNRERKWYG